MVDKLLTSGCMKITFNTGKIQAAQKKALKTTAVLLGREFTKVISEPGAFPPNPNDIVDLGQLRSSQQVEFTPDGNTVRYTWNTEYALFVHEGYTMRNGRHIEGRPWTKLAMERVNPEEIFGKAVIQEL